MTTQHALIVEDAFLYDGITATEDVLVTIDGDTVRLSTAAHDACITFTHDEWQAVARFVAQQQPSPIEEAMRAKPLEQLRRPHRAMFYYTNIQPTYGASE